MPARHEGVPRGGDSDGRARGFGHRRIGAIMPLVWKTRAAMPAIDSYDDLPYESVPIPDTHPDYLAAIARLFGVATAPASDCRVLELGCAGGGNLIPLAFFHPRSTFVGVDLGRRHVEAANRLIESLGLVNVRVVQRDVRDDLTDLGTFDYILVHGLYSWVPAAARSAILTACGRLLREGGVAYVSYNTLPGWHARAGLRAVLLAQTPAAAPALARLNAVWAVFDRIEPALRLRNDEQARVVLQEIEYLRRAPASYVYHEYLAPENTPVWFADFIAQARAAGLEYLADAGLATMFPETLGEEFAASLAGESDRIQREQWMDYARWRKFRRTLLVRAGTAVRERPDPAMFGGLAFYADLSCEEVIDLASDTPQDFVLPGGGRCAVRHPLAKAALVVLSARYPESLAWPELLERARALLAQHGGTTDAAAEAALREELFSLVAHQAVRVGSVACGRACAALPERPRANALARAQAKQGQVIASARHVAVELDVYGARLTAALDGRLDVEGWTDWIAGEIAADGHPLPPRAALREAVKAVLWTLARAGLLDERDADVSSGRAGL